METEHETKQDIDVNTRAHIFGVWAFFVILTALAIYVMLTNPSIEL